MKSNNNVVITYDAYRACDVADIEREAIARYQENEHYERNRRARERNAIRLEQERTRRYFLNQRLIAFVLLCLMIVFTFAVDLTCAIGIPIAIWMMCTKKMLIVNEYWEDHGGRDQWKSTEK